jgi:hypothetical protein
MSTQREKVAEYRERMGEVPGWLPPLDFDLIDLALTFQEERGVSGDLLEIGSYKGKCSILLGLHRQDGEELAVCDLFGGATTNSSAKYTDLDQIEFSRNFARFCANPPRILAMPSIELRGKIAEESCRFIHIDGGHDWEAVSEDTATALKVMWQDGVVVFNDFRSAHTPGVALSVWRAVANGELYPVCLSNQKLYAVTGDDPGLGSAIATWADQRPDLRVDVLTLLGRTVPVVLPRPEPAAAVISKIVGERVRTKVVEPLRRAVAGRMGTP